ncbi:hypothetical protein OS493_027978 [Desmophyllum pertusum]|uniref:Death domain-containing protein n=1 Tax=Desmophyllum pertusum TaxID=174260 RepID=A0A9W9YCL4_9CNID|nr:hypothetical protein OS493_027978 [Desmophyllum pertusum]
MAFYYGGSLSTGSKLSTILTDKPELIQQLALCLDREMRLIPNWKHLARKMFVDEDAIKRLERYSDYSPTIRLFDLLQVTQPDLTIQTLRKALSEIRRNDLCLLTTQDDVLLKDVMTPGSQLLQTMADKLNRELPAVKNWENLAFELDIPVDVRREFAGDSTGEKRTSPTKEIMKWVAAWIPDTTLLDVVKALVMIDRNDAVQLITTQFPDTVDSSSDRLDSSLHDSFSIDKPINDPTGETLSSRYKREESGPLLKQETMKQRGHCGSLPDRTADLVGRDGTCEQIMAILTSNKAAEIVAPPGYGKTSVAVDVAHRMIERGKFAAYVKTRGVACVEDLGCRIIEALGAVPGEDTINGALRGIRALKSKSVLIIENIDNLLHLEDQVTNEKCHQKLECEEYCVKMRGKYKKDDFLTFLKDIGEKPNHSSCPYIKRNL